MKFFIKEKKKTISPSFYLQKKYVNNKSHFWKIFSALEPKEMEHVKKIVSKDDIDDEYILIEEKIKVLFKFYILFCWINFSDLEKMNYLRDISRNFHQYEQKLDELQRKVFKNLPFNEEILKWNAENVYRKNKNLGKKLKIAFIELDFEDKFSLDELLKETKNWMEDLVQCPNEVYYTYYFGRHFFNYNHFNLENSLKEIKVNYPELYQKYEDFFQSVYRTYHFHNWKKEQEIQEVVLKIQEISRQNDCSLFVSVQMLEGIDLEEHKRRIREIVNNLKETHPSYYEILLKRHGESLEEWNKIPRQELKLYSNAFSLLQKKYENYERPRKEKNIFDKIKKAEGISLEEHERRVQEIVLNLKKSNLSYYNILIKIHGDSLDKGSEISKQDRNFYYDAVKAVRKKYVKLDVSTKNDQICNKDRNNMEISLVNSKKLLYIKYSKQILILKKRIYIKMQNENLERQKEAIKAWDILENILENNDEERLLRILIKLDLKN